jgi:hypothetical protein
VRLRARVDANHAAIVKALRAIGASVQDLSRVAGGVPDLLVGYHGTNVLLEVKDGTKAPSARTLTRAQKDWLAGWGGTATIVNNPEEAQRVVIALCVGPYRGNG